MSDHAPSFAEIELLYTRHHHWLVRWIRSRVSNSSNAADLAQDTFLRVLNRSHMVDGIREPRAWLAAIARGLIIDRARRESLERAWLEVQLQMDEAEMPSPEESALLIDTLERIDAMLGGLNPKVRSAFLLARLEGLSYKQIAECLQVSTSSVEKYMATAIRHCIAIQQEFHSES